MVVVCHVSVDLTPAVLLGFDFNDSWCGLRWWLWRWLWRFLNQFFDFDHFRLLRFRRLRVASVHRVASDVAIPVVFSAALVTNVALDV